tara:strand:- start:80 stop:481 length:402 start_codon:yes stop_codon:yes gene_type:complete
MVSREGKPWELFINLGKSGSCERAFLESLARAISIGLQHGVPFEEYDGQLRGVRCQPVGYGEGFIHSPADGLTRVIREILAIGTPIEEVEVLTEEVRETTLRPLGPLCPDCEMDVLIFEEGCEHCRSCGWSKC